MPTIPLGALRAALERLCVDLEQQREHLNALDAAVGDGDMGVSISNGFHAVRARLPEPATDAGKLLLRVGEDIEDNAGATIGALLGAAFLRAGRVLTGKTELALPDIAVALEAAEAGIRALGKAEVGDKTLLDVLVPVRNALVSAIAEDADPAEIRRQLCATAEAGVAATIPMRARFGRGRWLADRSEGHPDPGAKLLYLMVRSVLAD